MKSWFALNDSQMSISFGPCRCFMQAWFSLVWALIGEYTCVTHAHRFRALIKISSEMRWTPTDRKASKLQWFVYVCIDFSSILTAWHAFATRRALVWRDHWRVSVNLFLTCNSSTEELNRWTVRCVFYWRMCDLIWLQICLTSETRKRLLWARSDRRHQ